MPVTSPSSPSASCRARIDAASFFRGHRFDSTVAAYAWGEIITAVEGSTVSVALDVHAEPQAAFDAFVEELAAALVRSGIDFTPDADGHIREGGFEVGRVTDWDPPARAALQWRAADWDSDDVTELVLRCEAVGEATRITLELRGFGKQFWGENEVIGWFADQLAS